MYNKAKLLSSKGFTLIEIIASIALLVIVIGTLLPFFPQILSWTQNTDDELVASNLLSQAANDLVDNTEVQELISANPEFNDCGLDNPSIDRAITYEINEDHYTVQISICQEEDYRESTMGLYRTHIEILNEEETVVSDSYTYLTSEGAFDEES